MVNSHLPSPLRLLPSQGSDQAPGGSVHPSPAPIFSSPALAHWIRIHSYSNDSSCLSQAFSVGFQPVSSFFSGLSSYSSNMPISVGLQPASLVFSRLSCSGSCHSLPGSCSSYLHWLSSSPRHCWMSPLCSWILRGQAELQTAGQSPSQQSLVGMTRLKVAWESLKSTFYQRGMLTRLLCLTHTRWERQGANYSMVEERSWFTQALSQVSPNLSIIWRRYRSWA